MPLRVAHQRDLRMSNVALHKPSRKAPTEQRSRPRTRSLLVATIEVGLQRSPAPRSAARSFEHIKCEIQKFVDPVRDAKHATGNAPLRFVSTNREDDGSREP